MKKKKLLLLEKMKIKEIVKEAERGRGWKEQQNTKMNY